MGELEARPVMMLLGVIGLATLVVGLNSWSRSNRRAAEPDRRARHSKREGRE